MQPASKTIELPSQITLAYLEQGPSSGAPVIFLHGLGDSCHSFDLVLESLPEDVRAISLTLRGHGDSSKPQSAYRYYDFSSDIAAFLHALQLDGAVLVGHSLGSTVAQRFAVDHPELTRGLVLTSSFHDLPANKAPRKLWGVVADLHDPVDAGFVRTFQQSTLAKPVPREFFEETILVESKKVPAHVWQEVVGWNMQDDFAEQLRRLEVPTLLLWGDRDPAVPRGDQEALLAAIRGARLVVYEGHGHALPWEAPERFARDVTAFVRDLTQKTPR